MRLWRFSVTWLRRCSWWVPGDVVVPWECESWPGVSVRCSVGGSGVRRNCQELCLGSVTAAVHGHTRVPARPILRAGRSVCSVGVEEHQAQVNAARIGSQRWHVEPTKRSVPTQFPKK